MPSNQPVGIRNNNYLNVKNTKNNPWNDAHGPSGTDPHGHAVFSTPPYGVRAGIMQLRAYFLKHDPKRQTIIDIISEWAPADDTLGSIAGNDPNDPRGYAGFVARAMGVGVSQKLALFRPDGTIDNVGQLRSLFYAMAKNEISGDFNVPDADFSAGLELVEPGILTHGTGITEAPPAPGPAPAKPAAKRGARRAAANVPEAPAAPGSWKISGSVGRVDKGAANDHGDVVTVQSMLRNAAMILGDPQIDPGTLNGMIDPEAAKAPTVQAIVAFQSRFFTHPDGVIEENGRTWRELVAVLDGKPRAAGAGGEFFPFASLPSADWNKSPLSFASNRDSGARAHAGCDLYFPKGTTIYAIADGTVVRGPYYFYNGTYALEVDHGTFLARYGEVQEQTMAHEHDKVTAGQPIARVGHLTNINVPSDMLHLELYDKSSHGALTTSGAEGLHASDGRPFMRRKDLMDPAPSLNKWKNNLPGQAPAPSSAAKTGATMVAAAGKVPATGFCIHLQRVRQELRAGQGFARTISDYKCYWNGEEIHDLEGQMVERNGPGDNTATGVAKHRRIKAGTYPLAVQNGARYKTYHYAASGFPLPGLALEDTGKRTAILIHPCHDESGYLSSIGCINPAIGLKNADSRVNLADSRSRVIAIIESMKQKLGNAFPEDEETIPGAVIVLEGEP